MRKYFKKRSGIIVIALAGLFTISATIGNDYFEVSKNLDIFASLYKELTSNYVEEIDPSLLMRTGIDAMVASLDPYTNFISEAEIENYRLGMTGTYGGIGAIIRKQNDQIIIIEPNEGFSAHNAGFKAGDIIQSIDGQSVEGKESEDVTKILRGQPGTDVTISITRPYENETYTETLTRQEIKIDNVPYYGMLDDGIAYIKLRQFTNRAGKNVKNALKELKEENEVKGVIFDLRGNGGGLLSEAINVTNVFVDKGSHVVSTKGRVANSNKSFKTLYAAEDATTPLVVLTNKGSASASEIVSGAIQDLDRGIVLGQQTYGKGLVQNTKNLNYQTKLKLTTARYFLPSGRYIQKIEYFFDKKNEENGLAKDTLGEPFKTRNGRTVYGGNGVFPDVKMKPEKLSNVTISLLNKGYLFDFVTKYAYDHPIQPNQHLGEEEFNSFVQFLEGKDYDYETRSEKMLAEFKESAEKEKYLDVIELDIQEVERKIKHDKEKDLFKYKDEILNFLNEEVAARYTFQKGRVKASLNHDPEITKASNLLLSTSEYEALLSN